MARFLIGAGSEVLVARGLPNPLLPSSPGRRRVAVLCQPGAAEAVAHDVVGGLAGDLGLEVRMVVLLDGERAKSLAAVEQVYLALADMELGRGDTIVTVGGGGASDSGGFVAATWLRGVEVIHVPTTLLAAIDAAIGGKTGLNLAGKNLVGAFWHPSRVIVDLETLDRLPEHLMRQGAAEAIKAGFIGAPEIVAAYLDLGLDAPVDTVVPAAVRVKAEIVAEDPTETGRRALLNFGHTIGHGIEFASNLSHGESVALGMVAAATVSERRLGFEGTGYLLETLTKVGLPTRSPMVDRDRVLSLIALDKKRDATGVRMVLLTGVGSADVQVVTTEDVAFGLAAIGL